MSSLEIQDIDISLEIKSQSDEDKNDIMMDLANNLYNLGESYIQFEYEIGNTGESHEDDEFSSEVNDIIKKWVKLIWDDSDSKEWYLILLDKEPEDYNNSSDIIGGDTIMINDITEVLLEVDPSESFRVYIGSDVIRFTPIGTTRETAILWTDAVFAAMNLQSMEKEELLDLKKRVISFNNDNSNNNEEDIRENSDVSSIENPLEYGKAMMLIGSGMFMDIKKGIAGETPDQDLFPLLSLSKRKWVSLIWDNNNNNNIDKSTDENNRIITDNNDSNNDINPMEWYLVFKDKENDENGVKLLISDITEVLLEVSPSKSFKIYKSTDVIRLTPCVSDREVTVNWVDAVFGAMNLQTIELTELYNFKQRVIDIMPYDLLHKDIETGDGKMKKKRRRSTASIDILNIYYYKNDEDEQQQQPTAKNDCGICILC